MCSSRASARTTTRAASSNHVYFAALLEPAVWAAELATALARERGAGPRLRRRADRPVRGRPQRHQQEVPRQRHPVVPNSPPDARDRRGADLGGPRPRSAAGDARQHRPAPRARASTSSRTSRMQTRRGHSSAHRVAVEPRSVSGGAKRCGTRWAVPVALSERGPLSTTMDRVAVWCTTHLRLVGRPCPAPRDSG